MYIVYFKSIQKHTHEVKSGILTENMTLRLKTSRGYYFITIIQQFVHSHFAEQKQPNLYFSKFVMSSISFMEFWCNFHFAF